MISLLQPAVTPAAPPARPDSPEGSVHFCTEHLRKDLRGKSLRGGLATVISQVAKFVIKGSALVILARLLTPIDFGLVAMVAAFTGFVTLFKDLGLSMATVQRDQITHDQVSMLFWINVALSVVLMLIAAALAPAVAWFYGEPKLTLIMLAVAGTFVLGGISAQHTALLRRQMRFSSLAIIEVTSMAVSVAAAITLALLGAGYWALVAQGAAFAATNAIMGWSFSGWRPGPPRRGCGVRPMLVFGGNLTGFNVLNYLIRNLDNVLIGWMWGAAPLGLYSKAYSMLLLPMRRFSVPILAVAVPMLSRLQNDAERYRRAYARAAQLVSGIALPMVLYSLIMAHDLVLLLLGEEWAYVATLFRYLAPAALVSSVGSLSGWVYLSLGRTDRQLRWGIFASVLVAAAFVAGLPWGPGGVAVAFSVVWSLQFIPGLIYCFHNTPLSLGDFFRAVRLPLLATLAASAAVGGFKAAGWFPTNLFASVVLSFAMFVSIYAGCWMASAPGRAIAFELLREMAGRRLRKRDPAVATAIETTA